MAFFEEIMCYSSSASILEFARFAIIWDEKAFLHAVFRGKLADVASPERAVPYIVHMAGNDGRFQCRLLRSTLSSSAKALAKRSPRVTSSFFSSFWELILGVKRIA